jgi:mannose-6-phosphate isomerase-like protein (cupin superfamily)
MTYVAIRPATYGRHYESAPQAVDSAGARTWITRGANFVVAVTAVESRAEFAREDSADEHMLLLTPGIAAVVEAGGKRIEASEDSLTIIPPGASAIRANGRGYVTRVFSRRAADVAALAGNATLYADGAPEVAPLVNWPDPPDGFRLRHYPLKNYVEPKNFGRLFRCTNLMINVFEPMTAPRDPTKLTPHAHADFEQCSLVLQGTYIHHLRVPWTPDMRAWREDDHAEFKSPSVLIIPANVIHTTQYVGRGIGWFVDIFAPPRMDFSLKPGWVRNAHEYPMPCAN